MTLLLSLVCQPISCPSRSPETSVCHPGASTLGPHLGPAPSPPPSSWGHPLCSLTVTVMHRAQAGPSPLLLSPQSHWVTWCNPLHTGTPTLLSPNSLRIPRNLATTQHLQRPSARGTRRPHRAQHLLSRPVPSSGCSGQNLHFMEFIETLSLLSRE